MYSSTSYNIWRKILHELRSSSSIVISSVDVKEYLYCPRSVYYTRVLGIKKPQTERMRYGKEVQEDIKRLEKRRKTILMKFKLGNCKIFNKIFKVSEYGLIASVDYIVNSNGTPIPIELKVYNTDNLYTSHEYQVMFQAVTMELALGRIIPECYVYYVESGKIFRIRMNCDKRISVLELVLKIRETIKTGHLPEVRRSRKCTCCEFRNICPT